MNELTIANPANGQVIKTLQQTSQSDIARAFSKAKKSQRHWKETKLSERKRIIKAFNKNLDLEKAKLAKTLTKEVGKPISQSLNEIKGTVHRINYFLNHFEDVMKKTVYSKSEILEWEPLGVVGNISAWNYPYFVGSNVFIPALLTGNAVLYKPSEFATLTGQHISRLLRKSGIPSSIFQLLIGTGEVGASLLEEPIDGLFFTGSYPTGAKINQALSHRMIKVQMELGGKDPVYVTEDVDVQKVAEAVADGTFYNTGQSCCSVERIYVHKNIHREFVREFVDVVKGFRIGDPTNPNTYIGPLTRRAQIGVLMDQVNDALEKGARLETGGKPQTGTGNYFQPTVLSQTNHGMKIMRDESFGPIIGIQSVKSDSEAIEKMNDTTYGLTSSVYTKNQRRALKLMKEFQSGSVFWNCCDRVNPKLPWSGRGNSGIGSTLSEIGIQTFLQPKAYHLG